MPHTHFADPLPALPLRRRRRGALPATLASALALASVCAGVPPAWADAAAVSVRRGGSVRSSADCVMHPVQYAATGSAPDAGTWTLNLRLFHPDATAPVAQTTLTNQAGTTAAEGTVNLRVCGADVEPGDYHLEHRLSHGPAESRLIAGASTLTIRNARTRTTMTTIRSGSDSYRARIKVRHETPTGFTALAGARVRVQHLTDRGWTLVKGSRARTGTEGVAVVRFTSPRPRAHPRLRAVTTAAPYRAGSSSPGRTIGR